MHMHINIYFKVMDNCKIKVERTVMDQNAVNMKFKYVKSDSKRPVICMKRCDKNKLKEIIPMAKWLPQYNIRADFVNDAIAGVTVAFMSISQGLAFSSLAQVSPVVGLYMSFFPVLVYCLLGTSRHVSIGPFAILFIMVGNVVTTLNNVSEKGNGDSTLVTHSTRYEPMQIGAVLSLTVGVMQLIMFACHLGIVTSLFSEVFVNAFTAGAAVHVLTAQIKDILGIQVGSFDGVFGLIYTYLDILSNIESVNATAVMISTCTTAILIANDIYLKDIVRGVSKVPIPVELLMILGGILLSNYIDLHGKYKISIVGNVPSGMPVPSMPPLSLVPQVIESSLMITLVSYVIDISLAMIFARKNKYKIDENQELLALGMGHLVGAFFYCLPISGSLSRSFVQEQTGGRSQVAGLVTSLTILATLLWIGPLLKSLPQCILASIVVNALKEVLLNVKVLPRILRQSTSDGVLWIGTYISCILLDIDYGLTVGLTLTMALAFFQVAVPHFCVLGHVPNTELYLDISKYKMATELQGIKIFQFCGMLFYFTTELFRNKVYDLIDDFMNETVDGQSQSRTDSEVNSSLVLPMEELGSDSFRQSFPGQEGSPHTSLETLNERTVTRSTRFLIIDFSALTYMDDVGVGVLKNIADKCSYLSIRCCLCGCSGPAYEALDKYFFPNARSVLSFPTVHDAVCYARKSAKYSIP